ncbi:MAG TPA: BMP family ABC transporter substrate-binding protein [Beijerinckiaceae bacterium]|jgi:basic membrane protein A
MTLARLAAIATAAAMTVVAGAAALAQGTPAQQGATAPLKPAIVYDLGGKFDKSFNEGVYNGAEQAKKETGLEYRDFEPQNEAQKEQALRRFAREGFSPIVAVGFSQQAALEKIAPEYPNIRFAIIDAVVDRPNVRSITFKEHEGSYLVGLLAAMASKTGKVGFVGGMDIPLIRKFACGYVQGVKAANKDAQVFQNMTGTTGAAWNDPVKGGELARSQIDRGADVVYHAAGGTGIGVLRAAADAGKLGIGVDSNQNMLHPGRVLTSMVKRVDTATRTAFAQGRDQDWGSHRSLGLKEGGVAWADDEHNKSLITAEMRTAVEAASADIKEGKIQVHDYMADGKCPL